MPPPGQLPRAPGGQVVSLAWLVSSTISSYTVTFVSAVELSQLSEVQVHAVWRLLTDWSELREGEIYNMCVVPAVCRVILIYNEEFPSGSVALKLFFV